MNSPIICLIELGFLNLTKIRRQYTYLVNHEYSKSKGTLLTNSYVSNRIKSRKIKEKSYRDKNLFQSFFTFYLLFFKFRTCLKKEVENYLKLTS